MSDNISTLSEDADKKLPVHVALIPDGNRRWAKSKGLPNFEGHRRGFNTILNIAEKSRDLGIKYFTVWVFSTENWTRSQEEVSNLMNLALDRIDAERERFMRDKVCFKHLGRKDRAPKALAEKLEKLEKDTAHFTDFYFNLAFDYGGRDEIMYAIKNMIKDGITEDQITESLVSSYLYTKNSPDPDFIIRTSGEKRLSGLMPWQGVYAELYFADVHCPDFNFDEFKKALDEYANRERRRGGDGKK